MLLIYALLDKEYLVDGSNGFERAAIKYTTVDSSTDDSAEQTRKVSEKPPCSEKLRIGLKILPFILALCLSFFSEYLSISSVVTTIAFPRSHVPARDHFVFYTLSYGIGKFVGRSYLFIFECLPPDAMEFLKCCKTWLFSGRWTLGVSLG